MPHGRGRSWRNGRRLFRCSEAVMRGRASSPPSSVTILVEEECDEEEECDDSSSKKAGRRPTSKCIENVTLTSSSTTLDLASDEANGGGSSTAPLVAAQNQEMGIDVLDSLVYLTLFVCSGGSERDSSVGRSGGLGGTCVGMVALATLIHGGIGHIVYGFVVLNYTDFL